MHPDDLALELEPVPGAIQAWHANVDADAWHGACAQSRERGGRLIALWGSDRSGRDDRRAAPRAAPRARGRFAIHAVLAVESSLVWLTHALPAKTYPDLSGQFPAANRMQRAVFDLIGIRARGVRDQRQWLRHGAWPSDQFPLRNDFDPHSRLPNLVDDYPFVVVEGDGVHEIPVGPVHAGTIEPGHFRFSVLGERVLRLEERLGYTHKGIEKRFEQLSLSKGAKLAGRISGDATVAYAWAYAMAVESATACEIPQRAAWIRALLLERERIANHLGDLGFLGNDAGFAFGLSQFSRLKEDVLRLHHDIFGHRYLMDAIVPGGVARDIDDTALSRVAAQCDALAGATGELRRIYDDHAGVQDRFSTTGIVTPALAARLGLTGLAGRASGQAFDARVRDRGQPCYPFDALDVRLVTHDAGDVAARVRQRFEELAESIRLCRVIVDRLRDGSSAGAVPAPRADGGPVERPVAGLIVEPAGEPVAAGLRLLDRDAVGIGFVESWRGPVLVTLEAGAGNCIHRLHAHDPSWQNWPVIEHAIIGNIVPDFPLINKSFNLSYSGHDL